MKKITYIKLFALTLLMLFLTGCPPPCDECDGPNPCPKFHCPSTDANITWNSYGNVYLGDFGPDQCGWKLKESCEWHIYKGHGGGYGDTLQLASKNEEVILVWAYQRLSEYYVRVGWTGQTDKGIKIGSTLNEFFAAYPEFTFLKSIGNREYYRYTSEGPWVDAQFEDGLLIELHVF